MWSRPYFSRSNPRDWCFLAENADDNVAIDVVLLVVVHLPRNIISIPMVLLIDFILMNWELIMDFVAKDQVKIFRLNNKICGCHLGVAD